MTCQRRTNNSRGSLTVEFTLVFPWLVASFLIVVYFSLTVLKTHWGNYENYKKERSSRARQLSEKFFGPGGPNRWGYPEQDNFFGDWNEN